MAGFLLWKFTPDPGSRQYDGVHCGIVAIAHHRLALNDWTVIVELDTELVVSLAGRRDVRVPFSRDDGYGPESGTPLPSHTGAEMLLWFYRDKRKAREQADWQGFQDGLRGLMPR